MSDRYGIVEDGEIINVVFADADFAERQGWIGPLTDEGIGWTTSDGGKTWNPPAPEPEAPPTDIGAVKKKIDSAKSLSDIKSALQDLADVVDPG